MICTGVIPCLSNGLPKNNKILSMLVLFSWVFGHFEILAFFKQDVFSQFFKSTTIK